MNIVAIFRTWKKWQKDAVAGFTLVELLMAIGILSVLAGLLFFVINPQERLVSAQDKKRMRYTKEIETAMYQRAIDEWELLNENAIPEGEDNAKPICAYQITDPTCVNIDGLVSDYLASLPSDPNETNTNYTGYAIYTEAGRVNVISEYFGQGGGSQGGEESTEGYSKEIVWETPAYNFGVIAGVKNMVAALDSSTFVVNTPMTGVAIGKILNGAISIVAQQALPSGALDFDTSVARLTDTLFVRTSKTANPPSPNGVSIVGSFNGTNAITWATPAASISSSSFIYYPYVAALSDTKFVASYFPINADSNFQLRVGEVLGGAINWLTSETSTSAPSGDTFVPITALNSSTFVMSYAGAGDVLYARVGEYNDGGVATIHSPYLVRTGTASSLSTAIDTLDSDSFIVVDGFQARIGTVNGSTITWDTPMTSFDSSGSPYVTDVAVLDPTHFVVIWTTGSRQGKVRAGTISGGQIVWETEAETFATNAVGFDPFIDALDSTRFVMNYTDNSQLYLRVGEVQ
jgi:prepilin-type N-terminal cleavage/methylation domain-containing protein